MCPLAAGVHLFRRFFFFFNDPAPPELYTLSLHDALPILNPRPSSMVCWIASPTSSSPTPPPSWRKRPDGTHLLSTDARRCRPGRGGVALPVRRRRRAAAHGSGRADRLAAPGAAVAAAARRTDHRRYRRGCSHLAGSAPGVPQD